jgi:hypothetical protein
MRSTLTIYVELLTMNHLYDTRRSYRVHWSRVLFYRERFDHKGIVTHFDCPPKSMCRKVESIMEISSRIACRFSTVGNGSAEEIKQAADNTVI